MERFLRLDVDYSTVYAELRRLGPELAPCLAETPGIRVLRYADPIETIFSFLCSANNHVARIAGLVNKLAAYGEPISGTSERSFPTVETLAQLSEAELRAAGFGYRGASIPRVAQAICDLGGKAFVDGLKGQSHAEAKQALVQFPSIGPKLADCIALFGLDFNEAVPVDTHIWQAATRLYFPHYQGKALTPQKYEEFVTFFQNRFGDLAGIAQQALFYDNHLNWRARKSASNRV